MQNDGTLVGELLRYEPFGDTRGTQPSSDITDRGFTGHRENRDIGLTYMNARYYVPENGRFASADTLVPDPQNPQSFNRYGYVLNNPTKYADPSGHCAQDDSECWSVADQLYSLYGWTIDGIWTLSQVQTMFEAAQMMETWVESILMERHAPQRVDARGVMRTLFGGATIAHPSAIDAIAQSGFHHVTGTTVYMLDGFGSGALTHEMFHVLDNKFGFSAFFGSAAWGGGPADDMARAVGQNIGLCIYRSRCFGFYGNTPGAEEPPQTEREHYAWSGPSEDFAQTARYLVMDSTNVGAGRTEWFGNFVALQVATSAFGGTPYTHWQRTSEPKFRHLGWGYFQ